MRQSDNAKQVRSLVVDCSAAVAKDIEWLGDRYLLAKPINRTSAASHPKHRGRPVRMTDCS